MTETSGTPVAVQTAVDQRELALEGMSCASCAARIERALARQPGVSEARVNFVTAEATVAYDPKRIDLDRLAAAVDRLGYRAAPGRHESNDAALEAERCGWLRRLVELAARGDRGGTRLRVSCD